MKMSAGNQVRFLGLYTIPASLASSISEEYLKAFINESTLNPAAYPSIRRFENDIVEKVVELTHGNRNVAGTLTSGGTESIFMSLKVARDLAIEKYGSDKEFEVILPETIHPAFLKACHYLCLKPVISAIREDRRATLKIL